MRNRAHLDINYDNNIQQFLLEYQTFKYKLKAIIKDVGHYSKATQLIQDIKNKINTYIEE